MAKVMKPSKINTKTGLLEPVTCRFSPHHNERPTGTVIDTVIVHNISLPPGEFGGDAVEQFFCGELDINSHPAYPSIAHLRVAAHLFIKRTGEIIQFVPFTKRAWHAGVSSFCGREGCNDFSIGIELEGKDDLPYEGCQYEQLGSVIKLLMVTYPEITYERIVGHADVAPGRKTDPGPAFDWALLKGLIT